MSRPTDANYALCRSRLCMCPYCPAWALTARRPVQFWTSWSNRVHYNILMIAEMASIGYNTQIVVCRFVAEGRSPVNGIT